MATQRVSFCSFVPQEAFDLNQMIKKLIEANEPANYIIFNEQGESFVSGCYLVEQPKNETKYNIAENRFETITVSKLSILKFEFDLTSKCLIVWGNRNIAQRFLTLLSIAADNKIIIDFCDVDFKNLLNTIVNDPTMKPSKMKLNDIVIEKGIIASCNVNLMNQDSPRDLIKKYKDNISQLTLVFGDTTSKDIPTVSVTIYSSGSLIVYKDKEEISSDIIDSIQNLFK